MPPSLLITPLAHLRPTCCVTRGCTPMVLVAVRLVPYSACHHLDAGPTRWPLGWRLPRPSRSQVRWCRRPPRRTMGLRPQLGLQLGVKLVGKLVGKLNLKLVVQLHLELVAKLSLKLELELELELEPELGPQLELELELEPMLVANSQGPVQTQAAVGVQVPTKGRVVPLLRQVVMKVVVCRRMGRVRSVGRRILAQDCRQTTPSVFVCRQP